ncbi:hypothetical protein FO519_005517 [Halicephalobus sp. NKZ332]|nr:hypothetical protein FO519_005517 [Halicephalobus sp. NKZ332]
MTILHNITVESVRNQIHPGVDRWKIEKMLLVLRSTNINQKERILLEFDLYFSLRCPEELSQVCMDLVSQNDFSNDKDFVEKLKNLLTIMFEKVEMPFTKDFINQIPSTILHKIYSTLVPKENQNMLIFYFIGKYRLEDFPSIAPAFVTFYKTSLQNLKDDKDFKKRLALDMIFFHLFDVLATPRNNIPPAMIPEIYKTMLNLSITALIQPEIFTPEICSSGIPQIPPFEIRDSLYLPVRLIYFKFTSPEQRQHSIKVEDIQEDSIPEALTTLNNHKPNEKDVILLFILHGISIWKKSLGNSLLLLAPANLMNMSLRSIMGIWEEFKDFPLTVDLDSFHRGLGKESKDCVPLIRSIKNTVLPLKKHSKLISQANFFEDLYSVDKTELWSYMLNSLLILGEFDLAKNLISLQRDVTLSNLFLLQIELGLGKIPEALNVANLLLSNSTSDLNSTIFNPPCLIENCFVSTPISATVPYISLVQTHLNFLILCKNHKLNNENRDFILGDILIVSQVLDKHGCGKALAKFIAEILEQKGNFVFLGFMNYICLSHVYGPLVDSKKINFFLESERKKKSDFTSLLLTKLSKSSVAELDPLTNVKKFLQDHSKSFVDIKKF